VTPSEEVPALDPIPQKEWLVKGEVSAIEIGSVQRGLRCPVCKNRAHELLAAAQCLRRSEGGSALSEKSRALVGARLAPGEASGLVSLVGWPAYPTLDLDDNRCLLRTRSTLIT
jgi:hypothetical protein